MWSKSFLFLTGMLIIITMAWTGFNCQGEIDASQRILNKIGVTRGICVLLGDIGGKMAISLARESELLIYLQLTSAEDVKAASRAIDSAGFYGTRIFVDKGTLSRVHLADNLADALI